MADFPVNNPYGVSETIFNSSANHGLFAITPGSANTKGSWTELIASTKADYHGFWIYISKLVTGAHLIDFAVGGAGSEQIILENLMGVDEQFCGSANKVFIPLYIKKGSRISARCQHDGTSNVLLQAVGYAGTFETDGAGQATETFGADTSDSSGTSIDPGGTANTKGSWVELTASCSRDIRYILFGTGSPTNGQQSASRWLFDIAIGGAGSEQVVLPNISHTGNATERGNIICSTLPVYIPKGSRIAVRNQCSITDATDRLIDVIVVGIS